MDFPLALPVRCREHGKRNWERCLGVAYDPLGAAARNADDGGIPLALYLISNISALDGALEWHRQPAKWRRLLLSIASCYPWIDVVVALCPFAILALGAICQAAFNKAFHRLSIRVTSGANLT